MPTRTSRRRPDRATAPRGAGATPGRAAAAPPPRWLAPAAFALFILAGSGEIFRLGFFADDFHFLDVARRIPLWKALGGEYGVYPWYRPLSREIYFAVVAALGPLGATVARLLSLAVMAASTWLIARIGARLIGARGGRYAALIFATYGFTRFLIAWASGFQDMLALLLTLLAFDAAERGRGGWSLLWAGLAPFAKETAIVILPLLGFHALWFERGSKPVPRLAAITGVGVAVIGLHLLVRSRWHGGGTAAVITFHMKDLLRELGAAAAAFVGTTPVFETASAWLALLAALGCAIWLSSDRAPQEARGPADPPRASTARVIAFLTGGALLGLAPLVGGMLLKLSAAHAYYAFGAIPFLSLLMGLGLARIPARSLVSALVVGLVGWNVLCLGYHEPDMTSLAAWEFKRWEWREAIRLSVVARRLGDDLRRELPTRPESLVVCLGALPVGTYFQTEDGPATRVSLDDPTVRAYWMNSTPYGVPVGRTVLLEFDPQRLHLNRLGPGNRDRAPFAATSIAVADYGPAWAFTAMGDSIERARFQIAYYRAAARLFMEGPAMFRRELMAGGLADSTGPAPSLIAFASVPGHEDIAGALEDVLRHPLTARPHVRLGEAFEPQNGWVSSAVEYRIAIGLDPGLREERLRLADALERMGSARAARKELLALKALARGTPLAARADSSIARLDARGASEPPRPPRVEFGKPLRPDSLR